MLVDQTEVHVDLTMQPGPNEDSPGNNNSGMVSASSGEIEDSGTGFGKNLCQVEVNGVWTFDILCDRRIAFDLVKTNA